MDVKPTITQTSPPVKKIVGGLSSETDIEQDNGDMGKTIYSSPNDASIITTLWSLVLLGLVLSLFEPSFIWIPLLMIALVAYVTVFKLTESIVVTTNGILIPTSKYKSYNYEKMDHNYRPFIPFTDIEFFYPCSFRVHNGVLVPNGLIIRTEYMNYNIPHKTARVISKKLRVAMKDDFAELYRDEHCLSVLPDKWDVIEDWITSYPKMVLISISVFLSCFLAFVGMATIITWQLDHDILYLDPSWFWVIIIDSMLMAYVVSRERNAELFHRYYNALYKTWMSTKKGDKVPDSVKRIFEKATSNRIKREADVLEIFHLDRKKGMNEKVLVYVAILVQIVLILGALPQGLLVEYEPDYSDSWKQLPGYAPPRGKEKVIEDEEIYVENINVGNDSLIIRNSTVYGLGGKLLYVGSRGSLIAENCSFINLDIQRYYQAITQAGVVPTLEQKINVPEGASLQFLTRYAIDYGFDFGYVEISDDDENWTQLDGDYTTNKRNKDADEGVGGAQAFTGTRGWVWETMPLEGFSGLVTIRFRLVSDDHSSISDPHWDVWNIRIKEDDGTITNITEWNMNGWSEEWNYQSNYYGYSREPTEFTMELRGESRFSNCTIRSNSSGYSDYVINIEHTNVKFVDSLINVSDGSSLLINRSKVEFQNVMIISGENIRVKGSLIHLNDTRLIFVDGWRGEIYLTENSYGVLKNVTFFENGIVSASSLISTSDQSGYARLLDVKMGVHLTHPDGTNASGEEVTISATHGDFTYSGVTDDHGNLSTVLFTGYLLNGDGAPKEFIDRSIDNLSDMYRITIGEKEYYRYSEYGSSSHEFIVGSGPNLKTDIHSIAFGTEDDGATTTVSFTLVNEGEDDATNFTIFWSWEEGNQTFENLSLEAGGRMPLNYTMRDIIYLGVSFDYNNTVNETNEADNYMQFHNYSLYNSPNIAQVSGDFNVDHLDVNFSLTVDTLVMKNGTIHLSSSHPITPKLRASRSLLENTSQTGTSNLSFRGGKSYVIDCDLPNVNLNYADVKMLRSHVGGLSDMRSLVCEDSVIERDISFNGNGEVYLKNNQVRSINSWYADNMIMHGNTILGNPISEEESISLRLSDQFYVWDNEIIGSETGVSISTSSMSGYFRDNVIRDSTYGIVAYWNDNRIDGNTIRYCDIAFKMTTTNFDPAIEEILELNVIENIREKRLEYVHGISIGLLDDRGKDLGKVFKELIDDDEMISDNVWVEIQNETDVVYQLRYEDMGYIRPYVLQYWLDTEGGYHHPTYSILVYKDNYGYLRSTFTDVDEVVRFRMEKNGDTYVREIRVDPLDDTRVQLNITVSSYGANISNIKVRVLQDGDEIGTFDGDHLDPSVGISQTMNMSITEGFTNITAEIISKDHYTENNRLTKSVRFISDDRTITQKEVDHSIVVVNNGQLTIQSDQVTMVQEYENEHDFVILEGGSADIIDTELSSDHRFAIRNYGTLHIQNSEIQRFDTDLVLRMDEAVLYGEFANGEDPYLFEIQPGILNEGVLSVRDSELTRTTIYSNGSLSLFNVTIDGSWYTDSAPIVATGSVDMEDSSIQRYDECPYFFNADFSIQNSTIESDGNYFRDSDSKWNWGGQDWGVFVILESEGSIENCAFRETIVDIRNSSFQLESSDFGKDDYSSHRSGIRTKNSTGTIRNNHFDSRSSYGYNPSLSIFQSDDVEIINNSFIGSGEGVALECYWSDPVLQGNSFYDHEIAIVSYGQELNYGDSILNNSEFANYLQKWQFSYHGDDGAGNLIEDMNVEVEPTGEKIRMDDHIDPIIHHDLLLNNIEPRTRYTTWLDAYYTTHNATVYVHGYNVTMEKDGPGEDIERNMSFNITDNIVVRDIIPLPELGFHVHTPEGLVIDQTNQIRITIYNNGSVDATDIELEYDFYRLKDEKHPEDGFKRFYDDTYDLSLIRANTSLDITIPWTPDGATNLLKFEIRLDNDIEAATSDNYYEMTVYAEKGADDDDDSNYIVRILLIIITLCGLFFFGQYTATRRSSEKQDAIGQNFDADEFRKSLKKARTMKELEEDKDTAEEGESEGVDRVEEDEEDIPPGEENASNTDDGGEDTEDSEDTTYEIVDGIVEGVEGEQEAEEREDTRDAGDDGPSKEQGAEGVEDESDLCPSCSSKLMRSDTHGLTICSACNWMGFNKNIESKDTSE